MRKRVSGGAVRGGEGRGESGEVVNDLRMGKEGNGSVKSGESGEENEEELIIRFARRERKEEEKGRDKEEGGRY